MATITGTLLVQNADYGLSVSAVDVNANGGQLYITYIDASGNLKATTTSFIRNEDGSASVAMSGCVIV